MEVERSDEEVMAGYHHSLPCNVYTPYFLECGRNNSVYYPCLQIAALFCTNIQETIASDVVYDRTTSMSLKINDSPMTNAKRKSNCTTIDLSCGETKQWEAPKQLVQRRNPPQTSRDGPFASIKRACKNNEDKAAPLQSWSSVNSERPMLQNAGSSGGGLSEEQREKIRKKQEDAKRIRMEKQRQEMLREEQDRLKANNNKVVDTARMPPSMPHCPPGGRSVQSAGSQRVDIRSRSRSLTPKAKITSAQRRRVEENRKKAMQLLAVKKQRRALVTPENKHREESTEVECAVCLSDVPTKDEASLDGCTHAFCFDCIKSWSDVTNSCPLCKAKFRKIVHHGTETTVVEKQQKIECGDLPSIIDTLICMVCHGDEHEESLLMCDGCDKGCHLWCASPSLDSVPYDDWFCAECANAQDDEEDDEEGEDGEEEPFPRLRRRRGRLNESPQSSLDAGEVQVISSDEFSGFSSDDEEEDAQYRLGSPVVMNLASPDVIDLTMS